MDKLAQHGSARVGSQERFRLPTAEMGNSSLDFGAPSWRPADNQTIGKTPAIRSACRQAPAFELLKSQQDRAGSRWRQRAQLRRQLPVK
jgi:hypothetical protein